MENKEGGILLILPSDMAATLETELKKYLDESLSELSKALILDFLAPKKVVHHHIYGILKVFISEQTAPEIWQAVDEMYELHTDKIPDEDYYEAEMPNDSSELKEWGNYDLKEELDIDINWTWVVTLN